MIPDAEVVEPPPSFRFTIDTHTVCTGADGDVKWEADTAPVTVAYEDLSPELKIAAAKLLEDRPWASPTKG